VSLRLSRFKFFRTVMFPKLYVKALYSIYYYSRRPPPYHHHHTLYYNILLCNFEIYNALYTKYIICKRLSTLYFTTCAY